MPIWSKDDIARIIITVGQEMRITERGIVIGLATGLVESNLTVYGNAKVPGSLQLPHDAVGSDHLSVGVQQQQVVETPNGFWWGPVKACQDPTSSTRLFYTRLAKLDYNGPNSPGSYAQAVQGSSFPGRYDERMGEAQAIYDRLVGGQPPVPVAPDNRPDFNEYANWSKNNHDRGGTKVDLFLLHTQEAGGGDDAADNLSKFIRATELMPPGNRVSYHYCVSQAADGGVTVVDCVDTANASWSVLSANERSINLAFAGSRASWTRQEWLQQSKAIDVAAYIASQDCKQYGISTAVVLRPYKGTPGISDHNYVTEVLGDGTHTDIGPNFPVDVFTAAVNEYAAGVAEPPPMQRLPQDLTDRQLLEDIWVQLRGPGGMGWPQLGKNERGQDLTLVDGIARGVAPKNGK